VAGAEDEEEEEDLLLCADGDSTTAADGAFSPLFCWHQSSQQQQEQQQPRSWQPPIDPVVDSHRPQWPQQAAGPSHWQQQLQESSGGADDGVDSLGPTSSASSTGQWGLDADLAEGGWVSYPAASAQQQQHCRISRSQSSSRRSSSSNDNASRSQTSTWMVWSGPHDG